MSMEESKKSKHKQKLQNIKFEKRKNERHATPDEIMYIFQKTLEEWKTIKIFNVMKQENPSTKLTKKDIENISLGNARIYKNEVSPEIFIQYEDLRKKVYEYHLSS